jgi:hypothetical protein
MTRTVCYDKLPRLRVDFRARTLFYEKHRLLRLIDLQFDIYRRLAWYNKLVDFEALIHVACYDKLSNIGKMNLNEESNS